MMSRRCILGLAAVPLTSLSVGWVLLDCWFAPASARAFKRIRLGMTPGEVENSIGERPFLADADSKAWLPQLNERYDCVAALGPPYIDVSVSSQSMKIWAWGWMTGESTWLYVLFGEDRRAIGCYRFELNAACRLSWLDRIRTRLGLL
jgi:hypothetical protein